MKKMKIVATVMFCLVLVSGSAYGVRYEPSWDGLFTMPAGYQGIEYDYPATTAPVFIGGDGGYAGFTGAYLVDDDLGSQYVTNGYTPSFTLDYSLSHYSGVPKNIAGFAHLQRSGGNDDVASADLIFSNSSDFSSVIATISISSFNSGDTPTVVTFAPVAANYVRFVGVPEGQAWVGGRELLFMEEIPEPATLGLLVCGGLGLIAKRRRG